MRRAEDRGRLALNLVNISRRDDEELLVGRQEDIIWVLFSRREVAILASSCKPHLCIRLMDHSKAMLDVMDLGAKRRKPNI